MAWTDPPATWSNAEIVTNTKMNTHVRDQFKELWRQLAYVEFNADVVNANAGEASPTDVVSSGAITYAAYPTIIEFGCTSLVFATNAGISLWDGATDLGCLFRAAAGTFNGSAQRGFTPTAASHTYKIRIWSDNPASATANAGASGVGVDMPGYMRVWQKGGA